MRDFDSIIIGAGTNGLVCATLLARAGQRVLLLEGRERVGGLAAPERFADGFYAPVAHRAASFPVPVARALDLERHGLRWASGAATGTTVLHGATPIRIQGREVEGVSAGDQAAWARLFDRLDRYSEALAPFWLKTMPRMAPGGLATVSTFGQLAWKLRRLGRDEFREFLRVFALPMRDLADETLESEPLKAFLAWDGLIGSRMAPRSPNNAVPMLLYRLAGQAVSSPGNLLQSLQAVAVAAGVTLRTATPVAKLLVKAPGASANSPGERVVGVELANGEALEADRVISSLDPKRTFIDLLGVKHLEIGFTNRIQRIRARGLVAKLHLALSDLPAFTGVPEPRGRLLDAPSLDAIEFAFDPSKYGEAPDAPVMELCVPSLEDPSLAPPGQHVLSAHLMYVGGAGPDGWTDAAREALKQGVLARLETLAPGLGQQLIASELLLPADLEKRYGLSGGHWHHGEFALDQLLMMRPTYEAAQYRTPLDGLWLCGAGCHPAGDLTGAAGFNAAREVLK